MNARERYNKDNMGNKTADEKAESLTADQKKQLLFEKQKALLDNFLKTGAISKAQYDTSLNGLKSKMHIC